MCLIFLFSRGDIDRNDRSRFHITHVYLFFLILRRNYSNLYGEISWIDHKFYFYKI